MIKTDDNLLKLFSLTSVITLIIAVVAIGWFYKTFAITLLEEQSAETNTLLSKTIFNSIHIGIETKLNVNNLFSDESIKFITDTKNHDVLSTIIRDSIEQTPIVKVKIFNSKLNIIYSTNKKNIGKTIDELNVLRAIKTGESFTKIKHYDEIVISGKIYKNISLLTTYIPMKIPHEVTSENEQYGLFGIYVDVTERYQSIVNSQWSFVLLITVLLLVIYGTLYFEVRKISLLTNKKQQDLDDELRKIEKTNLILGKNFAKVATKRDRAVKENEAKSQFLANMSHELRTPLNAIIGYSEMIADDMDTGTTDRITEDSKKINSAGKHLLIIINDILDISKIEAGKMELNLEEFNVNDMVLEIVETSKLLAEKNKNKITVVFNNKTQSIFSDLTRTRQILLNLISNAIKFTNMGNILITVNDIIINEKEFIEFLVKDTGIGLDEKYINKIFSPFNQADLSSSKKYEGTGLGLTISKLFCGLMNGDISVKSVLGQGSIFSVKIPRVVSENKTSKILRDCHIQHDEYCASVLIIDGDPEYRRTLSLYLDELNYYVITAATGLDGLRVAQKDHVDIVILDTQLSELDCWSVLSTLKKDNKTKDIQIVLNFSGEECDTTKSNGVDAYITKPLNKELVEEILYNIVGGTESVISV